MKIRPELIFDKLLFYWLIFVANGTYLLEYFFFFFQNWYNVLKFEDDQFYQKETYLWLS